MSLEALLKNFAIDAWYKAVLYLGGALFGISLFIDVKGITNGQLQMLSAGAFLLGLGEWKNHKVAAWIKPPSAYTGGPALRQATIRKPDVVGVVLVIMGVLLLILAAVNIARTA
jgi:hypothetical protein